MDGIDPVTHVVVVFIDGCEAKVAPARLVVRSGDSVVFEAIGTDATVLFGQTYPRQLHLPREPILIDPLKPSPEIRLDGEDGVYPYAVHCKQSNSFARGNSDPIIIIRRSI